MGDTINFAAVRDTQLKPGIEQSATYGESRAIGISAGETFEAEVLERRDGHVFVKLALWSEHFEQEQVFGFEELDSLPTAVATLEQLHYIAGNTRLTQSQLEDFLAACDLFGIEDDWNLAHFISQCCHESAGFRYTEEIWGPTPAQRGYEGRRDLGNTQPGDGRKFSGGGFLQTTGRYNYTRLAGHVGDPKIVQLGHEYVAEKYPWTAAGFWWHDNNMVTFCRQQPGVRAVTRRVNGGFNGLADRQRYFNRAYAVFISKSASVS